MNIMCHRKLRTTNLLWNLTELANDVFLSILVWPKWLTGVPSHRSLHPWGQSPCPAGICVLGLPWHATRMPSFPLFVNAEHWCFRSQSSCSLSSLGPGSNVTKPFFDPSGTIFLLPTHCLHDSEMPLWQQY